MGRKCVLVEMRICDHFKRLVMGNIEIYIKVYLMCHF